MDQDVAKKTKSSSNTELVEAYSICAEALKNLQAKQEQPEVSSEEVVSLREELEARSEELQQVTNSLKKSLEDEEESEEKNQTTKMVLQAEHLVCCAKLQAQLHLQPPLDEEEKTAAKLESRNLLEKVKQLTEEVETLKKKTAGKFSRELDDLARALQDLSSDLAVLSGLVLVDDVLEKVFGFLDPASVKAVSLVSR